MDQQWHVTLVNGQQRGPISMDEVRQLIVAHEVTNTCYCWRPDFAGWVPAAEIPEFVEALNAAGPSVPPPVDMSNQGWEALKSSLDKGKRGAMYAMHVAKLKLRISKVKKSRDEMFLALGGEVYRQRDGLNLPESLRPLLMHIGKYEEEIAAIEKEMQEAP